jgi:hypothetical protein
VLTRAKKFFTVELSTTKGASNMKIGDYITATIYGHAVRCKVLAIHAAGTVDVQRADGQCFRISGLAA